MSGIFLGYLKIGFWMTFLIGGMLLLLPRISKRYAAKLPYAVWLMLALRLLFPFGLTLPEQALPMPPEIQEAVPAAPWTAGFWEIQPESGKQAAALPKATEALEERAASLPEPLELLTVIWLAGMLFMAARFAWRNLCLHRMLKRWEGAPAEETLAAYAAIAEGQQPPLCICPALESPMAAGLFSPKIYIPREDYDREELGMILRHEMIHCRRRDIWYKLLLFAAECLHWYNPLVRQMVRRAQRDLEISCDAEAVRGYGADYRAAYGQMILREAERGLEIRQGLNTYFMDGKKTLKERLGEILNRETRKKGLPLLALALLLAIGAGCAVKEKDKPAEFLEAPLDEGEMAELKSMAEEWAEALSLRDGKTRYDMMSEDMQAQFIKEQTAVQGEDWDYTIGSSSPWVNAYEVTLAGNQATIIYDMQDSTPQHYEMTEILKFEALDGEYVVTHDTCSTLRLDGKPYRNVTATYVTDGNELDHGIYDFMRQSAIAVFEQGKWQTYELEDFIFHIRDIQKRVLGNGHEEAAVDFQLTVKYRNPFRDPDDVGYIQNARAEGRREYDTLYREYYQLQEYTDNYRFICELLPGAEDVTEDTCFPETFRLYVNDVRLGSPAFSFADKVSAAEGLLWDHWGLCSVSKMATGNDVLVDPQLWIQDNSGRTNNGYFILDLDMAEGFSVAEDAVITLQDKGEVSCAEWMEILKQAGSNEGRSYSVETRQDGERVVISKAKEVYRP